MLIKDPLAEAGIIWAPELMLPEKLEEKLLYCLHKYMGDYVYSDLGRDVFDHFRTGLLQRVSEGDYRFTSVVWMDADAEPNDDLCTYRDGATKVRYTFRTPFIKPDFQVHFVTLRVFAYVPSVPEYSTGTHEGRCDIVDKSWYSKYQRGVEWRK